MTNPAAPTPTFHVVGFWQGPISGNNDATNCIAPRVDLGIEKTAPAQVVGGTTMTWRLTVTNHGPGNSGGFVVTDAVPAGVRDVTSDTPGCQVVDSTTVRCSEGALPRGSTAVIELSATVTAVAGRCFTNTATVLGNEEDPNPDNDQASAQTCVLGLTLTKTANPTRFSGPNTQITYTYTLTNPSTVPLTLTSLFDDKLGQIAADCPGNTIPANGGTLVCTANYTTVQADVDNGGITNSVTATATAPDGQVLTATAQATVEAEANPAITLNKSANVTRFNAAGTNITYTFEVKNTGNQTLDPVTVEDPLPGLSGLSCTPVNGSELAPNASMTCTATYTTTQRDVDNGGITNKATVTGHPPFGDDVTATDTVTIPADQNPGISVVKTAVPPTYAAPGTVITYQYLVTNTGNVTLDPVTLTDNRFGTISCPETSLPPGDTGFMTCYFTHTIARRDVDRGHINNIATVTGQPPSGSAVTATDNETVQLAHAPAISVAKSADITDYSAANTQITYTYLVTNNGNVTLHGITLTDNRIGAILSCPRTTLRAGAAMTCTASRDTTQADVDRGFTRDTATATGLSPRDVEVTGRDRAKVPAVQLPDIKIVKSARPTSFDGPDQPITYTFEVTNTGNVTLDPVSVSDSRLGPIPSADCTATSLAPEASMTCAATYSTTQDDVNDGSISNTGTAVGTPPSGNDVRATSDLTVEADQKPALSITKTASPTSFSSPGTTINYQYIVTNTGNVTLDPVTVTDNRLGEILTCPLEPLGPTESMTCTATRTTSQADLDRGGIRNTATAFGTGPQGQRVTAVASATVRALQRPAISLTKTATYADFTSANTTITYIYLIKNTGNVTLNPVTLTDSNLGPITCPPPTSLAPQAVLTCTAEYTTDQGDVDAGGITNTGTATGQPPRGPTVSSDSTLTIPAVNNPAIKVVKSASVPSFAAAGTPITYEYVVTNTGNKTLNPVTVTDTRLGPITNCSATSLAPNDSMTCTANYTTDQADVNAGGITNTATATGQPPTGGPVTNTDTLTVPAEQKPAIGILKEASRTSFGTPGVTITYTYLVTNSGNVTLDPVTVSDNRFGPITDCTATSLAPTASMTCTATHVTTQADVNRGGITNIGTATGQPPTGAPVSNTSTVTVDARQHPRITLTKTATPTSFDAAGTTITYTYRVTNRGNVTLRAIVLDDTNLGQISCPDTSLAPRASMTCTATYKTTPADLDNGSVLNRGDVSGTSRVGTTVHADDEATVTAEQKPAIHITKSASPASFDRPNTLITYSYRVTNTGNVTLHNVTVVDDRLGAISCPRTSLAAGAHMTCTATYVTTLADLDHGSVINTAKATGTAPDETEHSDSSTATVPAVQRPEITIEKTANVSGFIRPGTTITYRYLVTNTGNVTLHDVTVTDPKPGLSAISCPRSLLRPGESMTCTATYTTTQADVDAGRIRNTGHAAGTAPNGRRVTNSGSRTVPADQGPVIAIVKTASVPRFRTAGVRIIYRYRVTNDGNVTLDPVRVTDNLPGLSAISCPAVSLAPGASMTCSAHYTTTQADVRRGRVLNTGFGRGRAPNGVTMNARAPLIVPGPKAAPITPPPPTSPPPTSPPPPFVPGPGLTGAGPLSGGTALAAILGILVAVLIALAAAIRRATRRSRHGGT